MARGKKQKPWDNAFRRIRACYWPDYVYPSRPTAADLDATEKELNFRFPLSYRAFAEEFGLGGELRVLPRVLPLTRPPGTTESDWSRSVVDATRFYHTYDWGESRFDTVVPSLSFLQRVVVFALDSGYHDWVFDPLEVTNRRLREYRIYDIDRSEQATAIARSFAEWLGWIDANYRYDEEEGPPVPPVCKPDSPEPDAMPYVRRWTRRKKTPDRQSVQRWLQWNNNTVGQLLRSIRDKGRLDVFPILADALEEAGCQHDDLLESCRKGDPDVDGVWVLRILTLGS